MTASTPPYAKAQPTTVEGGRISFSLLSLFRAFGGYGSGLLYDLGLHSGQELILMQLYDRDGQTQTELQLALGTDHSTISRAVERMETSGLIVRTGSVRDRRAKLVTLTSRGTALGGPLQKMWDELEYLGRLAIPAGKRTEFVSTVNELERIFSDARKRRRQTDDQN